jgi:hypothetical protein
VTFIGFACERSVKGIGAGGAGECASCHRWRLFLNAGGTVLFDAAQPFRKQPGS